MGHLVLSRSHGERITFTVPPSAEPTEIEVQVVRLGQFAARLGCRAPNNVNIVRTELRQPLTVTAGVDRAKPRVNRGECD